jgi:multiple sugar transport system permease protein
MRQQTSVLPPSFSFGKMLSAPARVLGDISETKYWAHFLLFPGLVMIAMMVIYPVLTGFALSLQEKQLTRPNRDAFIGIEHYIEIASDPVFRNALVNTVAWVIAGTCSQFLLGLMVALALNRSGVLVKIVGILVLVPWILPTVVTANLWALMLDSRLGVINDLLVKAGLLENSRAWFAEPSTAMPSALLVALWQGFPFFSLMLLSGLQGIPDDLYEAASVDGAGRWKLFVHIVLPMLRPIIVATIILRVISMVNSPDVLLILTNGGPGRTTEVLSLYTFRTAYADFDFGYASALAVVMLAILMIFTAIYTRVSGITKE